MIIEELEKKLEDAKQLQTEAMISLMKKEQILRSSLHTYLDEGLSLLGKGVIWGRKLSEGFAAQNHRRAEQLKKTELAYDRGVSESVVEDETASTEIKAETSVIPEEKSHTQMKKMNRKSAAKKNKMRETRLRAHSNGVARSH